MTAIEYVVACVVAFSLSLLGTALIGRIGHRLRLTDFPNERSSHSTPKPRGGGLGIVFAVFSVIATIVLCAPFIRVGVNGLILATGAFLVILVGLMDDVGSVPTAYRFLIHLLASALVVITMPSDWSIPLIGQLKLAGIGGAVLATLAIAWMINLFNFMDGIDGIAGAESVFVGGVGALSVYISFPGNPLGLLFAIVAAASAGFLVLNWPPSRVFMGDVGSGFLGFSIGALAFCTSAEHLVSIWTWLILMSLFLADASVTLLRRGLRGERLYSAHRMHAYQRLSRYWVSHRRVTLLTIGINFFWLLPCAAASIVWPARASLVCLVAVTPILVAVWLAGAGLPD